MVERLSKQVIGLEKVFDLSLVAKKMTILEA